MQSCSQRCSVHLYLVKCCRPHTARTHRGADCCAWLARAQHSGQLDVVLGRVQVSDLQNQVQHLISSAVALNRDKDRFVQSTLELSAKLRVLVEENQALKQLMMEGGIAIPAAFNRSAAVLAAPAEAHLLMPAAPSAAPPAPAEPLPPRSTAPVAVSSAPATPPTSAPADAES